MFLVAAALASVGLLSPSVGLQASHLARTKPCKQTPARSNTASLAGLTCIGWLGQLGKEPENPRRKQDEQTLCQETRDIETVLLMQVLAHTEPRLECGERCVCVVGSVLRGKCLPALKFFRD